MADAFDDQRQQVGAVPDQVQEILGVDRRQFPPPEDPGTMTPEARELQDTIDTYKKQRRLKRITVVDLLGLLAQLGYRRA